MTPPPRKPSASTGRSGRHGYGRPRKRRSTRRRKTRRLGGCRRPLRGRSSQMRGEPRPAKTATIEPRTLFLPLPPSRFLSRSLRLSLITSLLFLGGCPCPSLWFAPASVAARASARSQKSSACLCGSEDHRRVHSCCSEQPETTNLCVSGFTLTQPICLAPSATSRCVCVCVPRFCGQMPLCCHPCATWHVRFRRRAQSAWRERSHVGSVSSLVGLWGVLCRDCALQVVWRNLG